jgi:Uma2 family endonuclease
MSRELARRWFTVGEYNRMIEARILSGDDRVELIDGEIIQMSPIGSRHAACVNRLNMILSAQSRDRFIVSVQNPIVVDDYSEPQPDISVLKPRDDFYESEIPRASDVLLVIEVADTTAEADRKVKAELYARAGIPEFLLIDLARDAFEAYSEPENGRYQSMRVLGRGEEFRSDAPQITLGVGAVLGHEPSPNPFAS